MPVVIKCERQILKSRFSLKRILTAKVSIVLANERLYNVAEIL